MDTSLLVLGLGNPGKQYARTRHNMGFNVIDVLAARYDAVFRERRNFSYAWASIGDKEVFLCKPSTYMNNSGRVFPEAFSLSRTKKNNLIVILDNANFPEGKLRLKVNGSHNHPSHNGLHSIAMAIGGSDFMRLYIGIGHPPFTLSSYVLGRWPPEENETYTHAFAHAADAIADLTQYPIEHVQNTYN